MSDKSQGNSGTSFEASDEIMDKFMEKTLAIDAETDRSNTKKNHVGLIYQFVTNHVVQTSVALSADESGKQKLEYLPVEEVIERLCAAFEKVNDRVAGW
ncbi:hypothetical protein F6R98_10355 [Candidatus Methylospira mobilis]|uniref:Uncharacterized protein n=1 Tax=Candidatus Methylospira mobilis TaxID=1808979 RepID=A0A5Q0BGI7_9GAMM|nr:hypothetical protein [Candidatus Methylospira mobilis]QFY42965.1 hypothetical protein F6R98_10355 [Candidatus Methylospira mobilis]